MLTPSLFELDDDDDISDDELSNNNDDISLAASSLLPPSTSHVKKLSCPCTTLQQLSNYITTDILFISHHRAQKPCVLINFVTGWNIFSNGEAGVHNKIRDLMLSSTSATIPPTTTVPVLTAHDSIHFFGRELCEVSVRNFQDVMDDNIRMINTDNNKDKEGKEDKESNEGKEGKEEPTIPFYCRLRPVPDELLSSFNLIDFHEKNVLFKKDLCACWIGAAKTITPLHFDTCHGLLAVVAGTKRVTMFPPDDTMYMYRDTNGANPNSSKCDWEVYRDQTEFQGGAPRCWDGKNARDGDGGGKCETTETSYRAKFHRMDETSPVEVHVRGGEMLYIPPGWWHTVENVTTTISVLLPFDMIRDEDLHPSLLLL